MLSFKHFFSSLRPFIFSGSRSTRCKVRSNAVVLLCHESEGNDIPKEAFAGVNMLMRKAGALSKPVVEIKQDGEFYILKTTTTFKTSEIKFKLDEEFEETRMDGSTCKTIITLEDGKLVQKQSGDKEVTIIREVEGDQMKTICKVDDIVSTRVYNKCE